MSVEVVKRITEDVKEFDNKEDFIKYYELNKNELSKFSTCILNKKFKIKGYHLGRQKGELKLIPLDLYRPSAYKISEVYNTVNLKIDALKQQLNIMNNKLNNLEKNMLNVLNILCQGRIEDDDEETN